MAISGKIGAEQHPPPLRQPHGFVYVCLCETSKHGGIFYLLFSNYEKVLESYRETLIFINCTHTLQLEQYSTFKS